MKDLGKWIFLSVLIICATVLMIMGHGENAVMIVLILCTLGWIPLGLYMAMR